jgi:hypothetical protein
VGELGEDGAASGWLSGSTPEARGKPLKAISAADLDEFALYLKRVNPEYQSRLDRKERKNVPR